MRELFTKSVERRVFIQAGALASDYDSAMLVIHHGGSWRVTEYTLDMAETYIAAGSQVFHWTGSEWEPNVNN